VSDTSKTAPDQTETTDSFTDADTNVEDVVTEAQQETEANDSDSAEAGSSNATEQQLQELQNQYLRLQADFENFKRRSRAEREDLIQFATSRLIQSLLPVADNLELALMASKDAQDAASVAKGVEMVARQFQSILEQEGLTAMQVVGQPFDPNYHEGVMQVEATEEFPSGTVVEELRKGYLLKGKVVRPAMVKVSQ
jgi:molecular chaperone GrpE